jgi:hypothetical protein
VRINAALQNWFQYFAVQKKVISFSPSRAVRQVENNIGHGVDDKRGAIPLRAGVGNRRLFQPTIP